jgi:hypothetical protein
MTTNEGVALEIFLNECVHRDAHHWIKHILEGEETQMQFRGRCVKIPPCPGPNRFKQVEAVTADSEGLGGWLDKNPAAFGRSGSGQPPLGALTKQVLLLLVVVITYDSSLWIENCGYLLRRRVNPVHGS